VEREAGMNQRLKLRLFGTEAFSTSIRVKEALSDAAIGKGTTEEGEGGEG